METKKIKATYYEAQVAPVEKKEILRTAAYCRVSTLQEEQDLSFESQCAYYEKVISADPKKELVGIYGDHGISGLHASSRPELQRMLADCMAGKIDYIMTKSISRLARNAKECQEILDQLKERNIPVYFEREGIISTDTQFELILKLLSSTAQEESNSQSLAMRWSHDNNIKRGNPTRVCGYGYRKKERKKNTDKHVWEIYEPEAKKVRMMFEMMMNNYTCAEIARKITEIEYEECSGYEWNSNRVRSILKNEIYKGDIRTHKSVKPDYLSKHIVKNNGQFESYYIEDHHEPIVSPETFDEVQNILEYQKKPVGRRKKDGNQ